MQKRNVAILLVFAVFVLAMIAVGVLIASSFGNNSFSFGGIAEGTILEIRSPS